MKHIFKSDPRKSTVAERPDETPKTFAELKPPGYWNGERFVEVRMLSDAEAQERYEQLWEWFGDSNEYTIPERFRPRRLRERNDRDQTLTSR